MNDELMKLPEGWTFTEIGEVCTLVNGKVFKPSDWVNEGIPIVRIQNLNDFNAKFNHFKGDINPKFLIDNGELLFAWSGTPGTSFGAHIWQRGKAILNQHIYRVLFNEQFTDKIFFQYAINEKLYELISKAHGGVGLRHVTKGKFEKTKIYLPPLNEQKRIVAKIEALQERSQRVKAELEAIRPLLDNFRQSVLAAAFRGDLTKDWREKHPDIEPASELLERIRIERRRRWEEAELEKMAAQGKTPKDEKWKQKYKEPLPVDTEGLPELPDGWTYSFIEPLLSRDKAGLKTGPFGSLLKKHEHRNNGVPVLGIENISSDGFIPGNKIYIDEEKAKLLSDYEVQEGDIIISRSGTVGEICIVPSEIDKAIISTNLIRVSLAQNGILSRYFCSLFRGSTFVLNQVSEFCSGSTRDFLNQKILSSIVFPIAPIQEQKEIVKRIESLFKIADTIEQQYQKAETDLETLNQSILAKAFRGELVPQNPNDEPASVLLERIRAERETHNKTSKQKKSTTSKTTNRSRKKTTKKPPPPDTPTQLKLPGFE